MEVVIGKCPICGKESHLCKCPAINRGSFAKYVEGGMIRLTDEEIDAIRLEWYGDEVDTKTRLYSELVAMSAKAQLIKNADAIDSMTADGWYLEDIVKAMRKEAAK